jgi:hypothetical protein
MSGDPCHSHLQRPTVPRARGWEVCYLERFAGKLNRGIPFWLEL